MQTCELRLIAYYKALRIEPVVSGLATHVNKKSMSGKPCLRQLLWRIN
jgi:hypothetical protein